MAKYFGADMVKYFGENGETNLGVEWQNILGVRWQQLFFGGLAKDLRGGQNKGSKFWGAGCKICCRLGSKTILGVLASVLTFMDNLSGLYACLPNESPVCNLTLPSTLTDHQ